MFDSLRMRQSGSNGLTVNLQDIQPLKVVHLGGDEVPHNALIKSPACDRFLAQRPERRGRLKLHFMLRAGEMMSHRGLQLQAWEDGLLDNDGKTVSLTEWRNSAVYSNTFFNDKAHSRGDMAFAQANGGYKVTLDKYSIQWGLVCKVPCIGVGLLIFVTPAISETKSSPFSCMWISRTIVCTLRTLAYRGG
jgi:Glycosyl hydrolase family 20, catalytic domain